MGYHGYQPHGQTAQERRAYAEVNGTGWAAARVIAAHHGAQSRAEARDRRIRDEDLALAGRPRLHRGNCAPVGADERSWR